MRIRTASDLWYTAIAWTPFLLVLVVVAWVLAVGVLQLEVRAWGTEFFVQNEGSINRWEGAAEYFEQQDQALNALNSGDQAAMQEALAANSQPAPNSSVAG